MKKIIHYLIGVYNKSLGSTINVQGKDNENGSYLIKLTIRVKLLIMLNCI